MKTLGQVIEYLAQFGKVEGIDALSEEQKSSMLTALSEQSQQVDAQTLFVAKQGITVDALDYVPPAGRWVLTEKAQTPERAQKIQALRAAVPSHNVIELENFKRSIPALAAWFYDDPSEKLKVVGVTGTNGKSSTTFYAAQLLSSQGYKVAMMGTLGVGLYSDLQPSPNTTLESVRLQRTLADFVKQGVDYVCMEISSHAVALGRIDRVVFETLALTQVTSDHLDFHQTQANYEAVKQALFERWSSRFYVVNQADMVGQRILRALRQRSITSENILTYSPDPEVAAQLKCLEALLTQEGIAGILSVETQQAPCKVPLWGQFNIENLLCAIGIGVQQGMTLNQILAVLPTLKAVPGRMQLISEQPTVIVDYAHTLDGLLQVLKAAKAHQSTGRLFLVFGCGGDRDCAKRPKMGAIAQQYADQILITNDNPRCEAPEKIVKEILQGMVKTANPIEDETLSRTGDFEHFLQHANLKNVQVILDRKQAIECALLNATAEDVVLVVGKGHETTQQFCHEVQPFSDAAVINTFLKHALNNPRKHTEQKNELLED